MNIVEVYKTSDGKIFESDNKAVKHQVDLLGELLDQFLPHDDRGNVTACDRFNILIKQLKDPGLFCRIKGLAAVVCYMEKHGISVEDVNKEASKPI